MKTFKTFLILCFCVLVTYPVSAEDTADMLASQDEVLKVDAQQKKVMMPFAAGNDEKTSLDLFVKKNAMQEDYDAVVSGLNNISPAAGVQLRIEF